MNPDVFITIAFSSLASLAAIAGALLLAVVRGRRRADAGLNPLEEREARSGQPVDASLQPTLHSKRRPVGRVWQS
jgi:hypothetical protein